jgi:hypothetical protein
MACMVHTHLQALVVREIDDSQLMQVFEDAGDVEEGVPAEIDDLQFG